MQCAHVSGEMPLWPRPHLAVIVMSRVEPPDSFLPSESMEPPAPAWRLGGCWTTRSRQAPHFLGGGRETRQRLPALQTRG